MAKCLSTPITGITPANFISATYTVTNSTVNAITSAFLSVKINSMMIATDIIELVFPPTITVLTMLSYIVVINGNITIPGPNLTISAYPNSSTSVKFAGATVVAGNTLQL